MRHPIALAPMGGSAGGALAAAVSRGGGLGMLGAGYGNHEWLDREVPIVASGTDEPWGVGFLSWAIDADAVERVLEHGTRAVMLSFGDPSPFVELVRAAGAVLSAAVRRRPAGRGRRGHGDRRAGGGRDRGVQVRLWDADRLLRRSVLYLGLTLVIGALYVGVATTLGVAAQHQLPLWARRW